MFITFAFILAFSLLLCSATRVVVGLGELEAAFLSSDEVTVDVICVSGHERHQKKPLTDGNHRAVKVTGYKVTFPCKGGATVQALGIPDEKHDELDVACFQQYGKIGAQPALSEDGAPFLSKSTGLNRFMKVCEITGGRFKVEAAGKPIAEGNCAIFTQGRSPKPLLSPYFTSGGMIEETLPENC